MARVTFYFDVGSPYAYLVSERLHAVFSEPVDWQPVLLGGLFRLAGRGSWALGDERRRAAGIAEIERRARAYGLPAMRWPDPWPSDYLTAMRAVTFAFEAGAGLEFAREAFRSAFRRGTDLSIAEHVFETAERAGLDRTDVTGAVGDPAIKHALRTATESAYARGVIGVPTIAIGDELFWGDDRLEDAASHLRGAVSSSSG